MTDCDSEPQYRALHTLYCEIYLIVSLVAGVWEAGESEAAMEEAVASILGERMKRIAPQEHPVPEAQLGHSMEGGESECVEDPQVNPILDHTVEESEHLEGNVPLETVEIPTTNLYMYDNPVYLNRLMKDNTFGRRVRHDAPYSHRLGLFAASVFLGHPFI